MAGKQAFGIQGAHALPGSVYVFGDTPTAQIGDKARRMTEHADAIARSGFGILPRVIFSEDRLNAILRHNGKADHLGAFRGDDFKLCARTLTLPPAIEAEIHLVSQTIRRAFGKGPVMVRSSGIGDDRGRGVYHSEAVENKSDEIARAMKSVLAGYFKPSAQAWRDKADIPPGFAIMLEPMVCQPVPHYPPSVQRMAPLLSGMGYSSTGIGPGYIRLSYGMGGGGSERLTREN